MGARLTQPYSFDDDESESIGQGFAKRLGDVLDQVVACCGRAGQRERLDVGRRGWDLHGTRAWTRRRTRPFPASLAPQASCPSQNFQPGSWYDDSGQDRQQIGGQFPTLIINEETKALEEELIIFKMSLTNASPEQAARSAKISSRTLATLPVSARNAALDAVHDALADARESILEANAKDMELAKQSSASGELSPSIMKRLDLSRKGKFDDMLQGIKDVRALEDPGRWLACLSLLFVLFSRSVAF